METFVMNYLPTIVALAAILGVIVGIGGIVYALRTGRITSDLLASGTAMLDGIKGATDSLYKMTGNPAIAVTSFLIEIVGKAARAAEQLYNVGEIAKDERNAKAKEIAEDLLRMAGIEVTDDRKAAIAVLLEAECDAMGHSIKASATLEEVLVPGQDSAKLAGFGITMQVPEHINPEDVKVVDVRELTPEELTEELGKLNTGEVKEGIDVSEEGEQP